jgi:protein-tyrosine phosphatase
VSALDLSHLKGRDNLIITMVCYGNICRSPMAAAVLSNKVSKLERPKIFVDSAGPNPPSKRTWEKAGYSFEHIASQFDYSRLVSADLVLVMDKDNHAEVSKYVTSDEEERKIHYLRQFDPSGPDSLEVPDPYSLPDSAFENVLAMVEKATDGLIKQLLV